MKEPTVIKTHIGTFRAIEFGDIQEANDNGFYYAFTSDDKSDIYTKHLDENHCKFGFIKR